MTGQFGAVAPILATSLVALLMAVPMSFGIAVLLTELAPPWLRRPLSIAVELLAGNASVIYGIWDLFAFVPTFAQQVQPRLTDSLGGLPWVGGLFQGSPIDPVWGVAGFVLGIMVVPLIASMMHGFLTAVPRHLRESAYTLGATRWELVRRALVPATGSGLAGGVILELGRALRETIAVTFWWGTPTTCIFPRSSLETPLPLASPTSSPRLPASCTSRR